MLPLLLLAHPSVNFPAGYYSLGELGTALKVEVSPDCAEEVYALRLRSATPEQVLAALETTGRLDVVRGEGGWQIRRSAGDRDEDRAAVNRYLRPVLARYVRVRTAAANAVLRLLDAPTEETQRATYPAAPLKEEEREVASLIYLCLEARELPFASLALPTVLAGNDAGRVGKAATFDLAQSRRWFSPPNTGDRVPLAQTSGAHLIVGATAKIMLDPITTQGADRIVFEFGGELAGKAVSTVHRPLTMMWPLPPRPEEVLTRRELPLFQARVAQTATTLAHDAAGREAPMPAAPIPVTDALLRAADAADQDLVAYVSPLSNRMLPQAGKRSVRSIVGVVNGNGFDPEFDNLTMQERCGIDFSPPPKSTYWPNLTARTTGPILTLRTETDFLDRMVDGPPSPPLAFKHAQFHGKRVALPALASHVADLKPNAWPGSIFSSQYLTLTNPTSFYPLARALAASPTLAQRIAAVSDGGRSELPIDAWDAPARRELEAGITRAADKCDAIANQIDPLHVARVVRDGRFRNMVLRVTRERDRYDFQILLPLPQGAETTFWRTWAKGVE